MITEAVLLSCLSRYWDLRNVHVTSHDGGMGSRTWFVDQGDRRWVAKAVAPRDGSSLAGGLTIAAQLDRAGILTGAPVVAAGGHLAVNVGDAWLALLTWVPGPALTGEDDAEQQVIGQTLARVHQALMRCEVDEAQRFHWVDPEADYLSKRSWLRPAICGALEALEAARPEEMTWGLLHGDPTTLVRAYLDEGILEAAEVEGGLAAMLRFRWAVQANYFAWRIAENDLTGISGPQQNEDALADARRFLTS
jgi:hypothetical protein